MPDDPKDSGFPDSGFPITSWRSIEQLKALSGADLRMAYDAWVRRYWRPLYAFYRSRGQSPDDAAELVQGFLCHFIERKKIAQMNRVGRFRNWLLVCARNYLFSALKRNSNRRNSPQRALLSLQQLASVHGGAFEPADGCEPEAAYRDAWRRDLLARALDSARAACLRHDRLRDYEYFEAKHVLPLLGDDAATAKVTWREVAVRFGLESDQWREVEIGAVRAQKELRRAMRQEIRNYVDSEAEVDEELRDLLS